MNELLKQEELNQKLHKEDNRIGLLKIWDNSLRPDFQRYRLLHKLTSCDSKELVTIKHTSLQLNNEIDLTFIDEYFCGYYKGMYDKREDKNQPQYKIPLNINFELNVEFLENYFEEIFTGLYDKKHYMLTFVLKKGIKYKIKDGNSIKK